MKKRIFALIFISISLFLNARIEDYIDTRYEILEEKEIVFYANNKNFCPYQYKITFYGNYVENLSQKEFKGIINNGQGEVELFRIKSEEILPKKITFKERFKVGDPTLEPNSTYTYRLPFADNECYRVTQTFNSRYSHKGWQRYSVDFGMYIGSPIYAARGGVVVDFKKDSNIGGRNPKYAKYTNYLVIYHDDGTFSSYLHLKKDGVTVNVGDIVNEGDTVGYSGNTGWSGGAHLHFMVYKAMDFYFQTIPISFYGKGIEKIDPKFNTYYVASSKEKSNDLLETAIVENSNLNETISAQVIDEQAGGFPDIEEESIIIEDSSIGSF